MGVTDLDSILATHADADHIGGLVEVLAGYDVEYTYVNGETRNISTYNLFAGLAQAEEAEVAVLSRGDTVPVGSLELAVLHPLALSGDSNADSIVLQLTCRDVHIVFTGDATADSEQAMLAADFLEDIDVLKVGHHGSRSSTTTAFLAVTRPELALISAGRASQYGHPHTEVLARLEDIGAEVWLTDTGDGNDTVRLTSDCTTYHTEVLQTGTPTTVPTPTSTTALPTPTPTATLPEATPTATASPTDIPPTPTSTATPTPISSCHASYPTVCIPLPPPDLGCGEIPYRNFTVLQPDPHRFDGDKDGVGCET